MTPEERLVREVARERDRREEKEWRRAAGRTEVACAGCGTPIYGTGLLCPGCRFTSRARA